MIPIKKMPIKKIKFCGFTRQNDVDAALALGVDYLGFVFYQPSPRYILPHQVAELLANNQSSTGLSVGLFVNHDAEFIYQAVKLSGVKILQFHGNESPDFCESLSQQLGLPYWKALHVTSDITPDDLLMLCHKYYCADALLFDTVIPSAPQVWGGTGQTFDWQRLMHITQHAQHIPALILSGGLTKHNVALGLERIQPWAVDVSSGIEVQDVTTGQLIKGVKDFNKMAEFIAIVRKI
jgi:phosphoribosylanthranilate isomerase